MTSTFPRNPQRDDCYDIQPEISHPEWLSFREQVARSSQMYTKTFLAGWADMDFNSHMKNTAYLDKTADVRQMFLAENGFPVEEFFRLRIGPVIMKDEVEYFKEIRLLQEIKVTYALVLGISLSLSHIKEGALHAVQTCARRGVSSDGRSARLLSQGTSSPREHPADLAS